MSDHIVTETQLFYDLEIGPLPYQIIQLCYGKSSNVPSYIRIGHCIAHDSCTLM